MEGLSGEKVRPDQRLWGEGSGDDVGERQSRKGPEAGGRFVENWERNSEGLKEEGRREEKETGHREPRKMCEGQRWG